MRRNLTLLLLAALLSLQGCAVHQWPEQKEPLPESPGQVTLRLRYATDFWVWKHWYDPKQSDYPVEMYPDSEFDPGHPGTTAVYDNALPSGFLEVNVKIYASENLSVSVAERSFRYDVSDGYDCALEMELPKGSYEVVAWAHLLETEDGTPFYDAADIRAVRIIDENYRGGTDYRDAFRGRAAFDLADTDGLCVVEMHRPKGKLEFETIDLSEFLDRETERRQLSTRAKAEDYEVVISYPYYYPNGYNAVADDIASGSGYRFASRMTLTGESTASMGFDYIFINDIDNGRVQAQVTVFDHAGVQVAGSQTISVPIRRDSHTLLRGAFLSINASGGVGVDPDYDGDHNITVP